MSVLIKGMEMPTEQYGKMVITLYPNGHVAEYVGDMGRVWEAVPVPPHGDLIDRDALKAAICSRLCIKSEKYLLPEEATIVNEIFVAPIIIPEEEG